MRTALVLLGGLLLQAGCGGETNSHPTAKLAGHVQVAGQPVHEGRISFFPVAAAAASGGGQPDSAPITDGAYEVARAPKGAALVTFSAIRETGKVIHEHDHAFPERVSIIPLKYQAGIPMDVDGDNPALDFDLK